MPKIKYVPQPKGTSGNWLTQNRLNTQRRFLRDRDVYKVKYNQYKKEQADLAEKSMKKMIKYTGTGLALSGSGIYVAGKKNRNNSR